MNSLKNCVRFLDGHFLLRKWKTSNIELPYLITHNNSGNEDINNKVEKVLGISWGVIKMYLFTILRLLWKMHINQNLLKETF